MRLHRPKRGLRRLAVSVCGVCIGISFLLCAACGAGQEADAFYSVSEARTQTGEIAYAVTICNADGDILEESMLQTKPQFRLLENGILQQCTGAGNVTQYQFFDVADSRVSPIYENPQLIENGKIVYMALNGQDAQLIVRDIFDETVFWSFNRDFSETGVPADALTDAAFLDEHTLEVTYLAGEDFETVQEALILQ